LGLRTPRTNDITGAAFTADEQVFTQQGCNRIGHKNWKSLYRAYMDASFTQRVARPTSCAPTARVGDGQLIYDQAGTTNVDDPTPGERLTEGSD